MLDLVTGSMALLIFMRTVCLTERMGITRKRFVKSDKLASLQNIQGRVGLQMRCIILWPPVLGSYI